MGAMLDYSHYTNDSTYDDILTTAISSQVIAPTYDLMVPAHAGDEGNDDQAFWAFTVLSAAERNFPQTPDTTIPSWLQVAENAFNTMAARWNTSACGGGLLWQIFASNPNGLDYRNSVSNGGLFQMSARLYRATGNQTYLDWANKVWEWSTAIGFVDENYNVYDGADSSDNCTIASRNNLTFSYGSAIYMYGAAVLANATNDTDASSTWTTHTEGLFGAAQVYFNYNDNSTGIMYERSCEPYGSCSTDMYSFKAYLSRFMYASAIMVPSIASQVSSLMEASAAAAGVACSGDTDSTTCGTKWYIGGYDGNVGLGQEMSALEAVQGLLAKDAPAPLRQGEIEDVRQVASTATATTTAASATTASVTSIVLSATASSAPAKAKRARSLGVRQVPGWGLVAGMVGWMGWVMA